MFIRHPPLWLRPQKWKPAVLKRKNRETKTSWESENSPRLCLLALESLRASLWPMELRKIIASTTSPSCIVLVAFLATQGPTLRPDGAGTWRASSVWQVNTSVAWKDDPSFFWWCRSLRLPLPFFFFFLLVSFSLGLAASASMWSEGWCCDCKSKQAWGTVSHHTGGSSGKKSSKNSDVAWKGRIRVLLKMRRRRKRKKQYNPGGSTHQTWAGLAGNQQTRWSNFDQLPPESTFTNLIKDARRRYYLTVGGSRICLSRHLEKNQH